MKLSVRALFVVLLHSLLSLPGAGDELRAQAVIALPERDQGLDPAALTEVHRLGGSFARGWDTFGYVPTVAFDERGLLYALDADQNVVLVANAEGSLVRRLGREGQGPGEFRSAKELVVARDGNAVVYDAGKRVYHLFAPNGDFVGQFFPRNVEKPDDEMRGGHLGRSFLALAESEKRTVEVVELVDGVAFHRPFFSTWRPADKVHPDGSQFSTSSDGTAPRPFEWWFPTAHFERLPAGGIAVADTSAYLIRIVGPDGGVDRLVRRPLSSLEITRSMRNEAKQRERRWYEGLPAGPFRDLLADAVENMRFFAEVPVICGMRTTWDGGIWIKRCDADPFGDVATVDVIAPDGSYAGTFPAGAVELPDAFGPDGLVAFIEKDELDATVVVVARASDPALR